MRRSLLVLALLVLLPVIGCGNDSSASRSASSAVAATAATTTPATAAQQPRPPRKPVRLTILASGDFLIHSPVWQRAAALAGGDGYDFAPLFRYVKPYVQRADLAICHVETPMTSAPPSGYPVFNTPPALARAIRSTGWDACDTASNHTLDQGSGGIAGTVQALDRAGVRHTGSFTTPQGSRRTLLLDAGDGVKVAFLAYTEMTNGIPAPHPWSVNIANAGRIVADARRARERGADVVLVNLHAGDEYGSQPSAFQRTLADALMRSPAITAVVGQHVHVVQPIARVHGKPVVFGEGNLISNQTPACCAPGAQDGLLAQLHLVVDRDRPRRTRVSSVTYVPVWVRQPDYAVLPIGDALRQGLADPATLRASYDRTVSVAGRRAATPVPARLP
ncbi:CapA family protein [Conexibacter sp. CPCC 206217]|uniref:CapA family protein n=1 Tax=Conexibacter sp. CPCC 206217 TaxID=3064574 RepID=UPI0027254E0C|nr:CapA family protein [Conexibacter sp. CPCC 206217]MDO8212736.1 CapA family protein [Conexibacter sp. CPCC 206217]